MASSLTDSMASFQSFNTAPNFSSQQAMQPVDTGMCSDEEDWTSVSDAAERRRIQNRNAQRKYRRNLKRRVQALEQQQQQQQQQSAYRQNSPFPPTSIDLHHLFGPSAHGFSLPIANGTTTPLTTPPCEPAAMSSQCATCHQCGSLVPNNMALHAAAAASSVLDSTLLAQAGMTTPPFHHIVEDWTQTMFDDVVLGPTDITMTDSSNNTGTTTTTTTTPPNSVCGSGSAADSSSSSCAGGLNISLSGSDSATDADNSSARLAASPSSSLMSSASRARARASSARQSISGRSLLHIAAERGNEQMVAFLLEQGGDPNAVDDAGWTPLHLAVEQGHRETVSRLLEAGGNLFARTER